MFTLTGIGGAHLLGFIAAGVCAVAITVHFWRIGYLF